MLYDQLVPWYDLLDPLADHQDEATDLGEAFRAALGHHPQSLLELGAGAGNNAHFLGQNIPQLTLTDLSEKMLALSRTTNPTAHHVVGDMRTLRLGQTFEAVLIHDAIVYLTTEPDLRAALHTAWLHLAPGGVAIFAPDCIRESFHEMSEHHQNSHGTRAMHCLEWSWDPDPDDTTYTVEYAFLLRDGTRMESAHDTHVEGLFSRETWLRLLREVGFEAEIVARPLEDEHEAQGYNTEVYLGRKRA
jgi:trans-aconitate methyltransferase